MTRQQRLAAPWRTVPNAQVRIDNDDCDTAVKHQRSETTRHDRTTNNDERSDDGQEEAAWRLCAEATQRGATSAAERSQRLEQHRCSSRHVALRCIVFVDVDTRLV